MKAEEVTGLLAFAGMMVVVWGILRALGWRVGFSPREKSEFKLTPRRSKTMRGMKDYKVIRTGTGEGTSARYPISPETITILREGGWSEGRRVVRTTPTEVELELFPKAEEVLSEFGGLHVGMSGAGIDHATSDVEFSPDLCSDLSDELKQYAKQIGKRLYPLGECSLGYAFFIIDEDGRTYLMFDELESLAPTFWEGLEGLLLGKRMEPRSVGEGATPYASLWWAAARSGYASPVDWMRWADDVIRTLSHPPEWILDLSCARDMDAVTKAVHERRFVEMHGPETTGVGGSDNGRRLISMREAEEAVLGYFWLRFRRGDWELRDCLRRAGDFADASDDAGIECEDFYHLLNRHEAGDDVWAEAEALLGPLARLAEKQWVQAQAKPRSATLTDERR